jgi:hypothetical protein
MSQLAGETSQYHRIGGEAPICVTVDRFYERVLADPELSELNISEDIIAAVGAALTPLSGQIVNTPSPSPAA